LISRRRFVELSYEKAQIQKKFRRQLRMSRINSCVAALLFATMFVATPAVKAQVQVLGAGSSAMWQAAGYAAWKDLAGAGARHYTVKGKCTSGNCAQLKDQRSTSIPVEAGNLWVVWNSTQTKFWAYLTVDSVVGNRCFKAAPRCVLQIDAETKTVPGQNLIASALWGKDASALPSAVYNALNGHAINAGFTDIRPEDAKFAQCRVVSALNTKSWSGLGYGTSCTQLIGTRIESSFTTATANPTAFNLKGTDPFTGQAIPASTTIPVGATPIVFVVNRINSAGLGSSKVKNVTVNSAGTGTAQLLFEGEAACNATTLGGGNYPVTVLLREPISGTMNTTEFTNFRLVGSGLGADSQEENVITPGNNPLDKSCKSGGGKRRRGIGTSEIISGVAGVTDSIGYIFWGYSNVSKIAGPSGVGKYLTLNGVDPIQSSYTGGTLPTCKAPCPAAPGKSFPHLRDGTYRAWSVLRVVTDAAGPNHTNVSALVTAAQNNVNATVPDFVPFKTTNGSDPGLSTERYRSHYPQSGFPPNNGLGGQTESGGDVGGCIEKVSPPPGVLGCRQ
jgi:ABC-type phosphate transport system substrate-binding protein